MKLQKNIRRLYLLLLLLCIQMTSYGQVPLRYEDNYSLTYDETILAYEQLDEAYREAKLISYGSTDAGKPLNLFVISSSRSFDPEEIRKEDKRILMFLNGIHPGESCGIDASVQFAREILSKSSKLYKCLENTVVCIVPVYNIGGTLNRSIYNRPNQEILIDNGFRANARNLDLNRDFVKLDSRNARTFTNFFHLWDPDVFLDNHVTNGSDHQYTVTLISNVVDKMNSGLGEFLDMTMLPELYSGMRQTPYEMIPYGASVGRTHNKHITQDMTSPRLSSGYTALFNTISFLNEIHLYKTFPDQVKATYHLMKVFLETTSENSSEIASLREQAIKETCSMQEFVLDWVLDTTRSEKINFKGYVYKDTISEITGYKRYYYDRSDPWEMEIPLYNHYKPAFTVQVPDFFIISQAWNEVIERLELNQIEMSLLPRDTVISVDAFYIDDISFADHPGNGHFLHKDLKVRPEKQDIQFYKGDVIISLDQPGNHYLMETLDPRATDSFMRWNFFDPILNRGEYFDRLTFEQKAIDLLKNEPAVKARFEEKKANDPEFAASDYAQIYFLFTQSPWADKSYRRYPVYSINNEN